MEVRVRKIDEANSKHFTRCKFSELDQLIKFIQQSSGFYFQDIGQQEFHSYQLVLGEGGAYAEIIIGKED